jgi:hypothetical protein
MLSRTARRVIPAAVLVASGLALAACQPGDTSSSASGQPAPAARQSSSSAPSGGGSTSTGAGRPAAAPSYPIRHSDDPSHANSKGSTGSSGAQHAAPGPAAVPTCKTGQLNIAANYGGGAAGHVTFQLDFQNTGTASCALRGYPGVSFVKSGGTQLGNAARRTDGAPVTVTLPPKGHAYADAQAVDGQSGYSAKDCDLTSVPALRVYPPNQTASANVPWNRQECVGPTVQNLTIGPVHAG